MIQVGVELLEGSVGARTFDLGLPRRPKKEVVSYDH